MIEPAMTVLVVGATGSIGEHVVTQALKDGLRVRALVRQSRQASRFDRQVDTVVGDLTSAESLGDAVEGIDAVIFTHGSNGRPPGAEAVDYGAVRSVLAALGERKVRIALMTTIGVTDRKGAHDWKRRGERLVRASGMDYTIVRPGWFDYHAPDQQRLVFLQGDKRQSGTPSDGVVARSQIAEVLVRSLRSDAALRKTFELVAETGPATQDLDTPLSRLAIDPAGRLDGALDADNMPVEDEPRQVRADLQALGGESSSAVS